MRNPKRHELAFDLGFNQPDDVNHGEKIAHYLCCDYAMPDAIRFLGEGCRQRFSKEIAAGRLEILKVGVGSEQGFFGSLSPNLSSVASAVNAQLERVGQLMARSGLKPQEEIERAKVLLDRGSLELRGRLLLRRAPLGVART